MNEEVILKKIEEVIKEQTGIIIDKGRRIDLEIVLRSRLIFHKMTPERYIEFLRHDHNEVVVVASCFTVQETSFYRYKSHFDRLKLTILPELIEKCQKTGRKKIKILSAGCATGEEPYTISMILHDLLPDIDTWSISITATDINENAIVTAKEAVYSEYRLRNIESWYISRYFTKVLNGKSSLYKLNDIVKKIVTFRHCNLIREPFELSDLTDLDLIFCENVIIYFCMDSIQRLINNFYDILKMDGHLFLGYSETLNFIHHKFSLSWWHDSYIYKKSEKIEGEVYYDVAHLDPVAVKGDNEEKIHVNLKEKSYEDIIELILLNYSEELFGNVSVLLKKVEESKIKIDEIFYLIKAEFEFDGKDFINAGNECRKAMSINPHSIDAHILLVAIYLELKMYDSAMFECKTSLYIDRSSILANYYHAELQKSINNVPEYANYLETARSLFRENGGTLNGRIFPVNENTRKKIYNDLLDIQEEVVQG